MIRALNNSFIIAWKYLYFHKVRSLILIFAIAIIIVIPILLELIFTQTQHQLRARAIDTPYLLGMNGSSLDLTMQSLYFSSKPDKSITMQNIKDINQSNLAKTIPLYLRFYTDKTPLIGTSNKYYQFRNLALSQGDFPNKLGEVVIGATVAIKKRLQLGDSIITASENVFDLAGSYPLKLTVAGILKPKGTADDTVIFFDIKTGWILAGLGHGHKKNHSSKSIKTSKKIRAFNTISTKNIQSFHFHGSAKHFPVTAAIVIPNTEKSAAILLGRYLSHPNNLQLIQPKNIINLLVQTIYKLKSTLNLVIAIVAISTFLAIGIVFLLAIRLRSREIQTIYCMGCSRMAICSFIAAEIITLLSLSLLISMSFIFVSKLYLSEAILYLVR